MARRLKSASRARLLENGLSFRSQSADSCVVQTNGWPDTLACGAAALNRRRCAFRAAEPLLLRYDRENGQYRIFENAARVQILFRERPVANAVKFDVLLFWSLDRLSREGALETLQHLNRLT